MVSWGSRAAILLIFSVGVMVLLFWLAGKFAPKISMQAERISASDDEAPGIVAEVRLVRLPLVETAVGTIRPVHETTIGAKLLARVVEVNMKAGQVVMTGDVLVRLDDKDLRAKRRQAEAVLKAAEVARVQAVADANRSADLLKSKAVSRQENERAGTALKSADAELSRVKESINEIQATLDWATIRSPIRGIVIDKKVDVGDMVTPGQMLATLFDPKRMQLVASVRESLAHRLKVGQPIEVQLENFSKRCTGTISEIVPEAESSSRAFQVKITGPCPEGVYSGTFGRILIPLDDVQILVIPRQAVQSVGQLDLVNVASRGVVSRRAVRLGRTIGEDVEVLSGLSEGEQVQVPVKTAATRGVNHG
ncbi:MAG TPA: efflux RND transporter periplasmic adaptor subunit [Pirellulales bacterium]|nr:efflux RND transporter periplasmic adaptor subunit [Pirellulales bacterium]